MQWLITLKLSCIDSLYDPILFICQISKGKINTCFYIADSCRLAASITVENVHKKQLPLQSYQKYFAESYKALHSDDCQTDFFDCYFCFSSWAITSKISVKVSYFDIIWQIITARVVCIVKATMRATNSRPTGEALTKTLQQVLRLRLRVSGVTSCNL